MAWKNIMSYFLVYVHFYEAHARDKNSTRPLVSMSQGSHITYYSLKLFIAYAFKGQVHVFAGRVKIVSHSSCRTSAILKYFCPLTCVMMLCVKR